MNNKSWKSFSIFIVILLALAFCFLSMDWGTLSSSSSSGGYGARPTHSFPQDNSLAALKDREFLGVESAPVLGPSSQPVPDTAFDGYVRPSYGLPNVDAPAFSAGDYQIDLNKLKAPRVPSVPSSYREGTTRSQTSDSRTSARTSNSSSGRYQGAGSLPQTRRERQEAYAAQDAAAQRGNMLSSASPKMNREQEKKLEQQLKGMSSGIDRAIAKAMIPKDKKQANIEKYIQRRTGGDSVQSGPFASVVKQVSDQKSGVVNTITDNFGSAAGKQAGQMMDSFKNEMQSAVNAPGQTQEQIAANTTAINKKYQNKLQKFSQDQGVKKAESDRLKKDNELKAQIAAKYDEKTAKEASAKIDAAREKDLALMKQNLPEKEFYNQTLANQRELNDSLNKVILDNGKSLEPLQKLREDLTAKEIETQAARQETGEVSSARWVPTKAQVEETQKSLQADTQKKLDIIKQNYGPQAAQQAQQLYHGYEERYLQALQSGQDRVSINKQLQKEVQDINKQLESFQQKPEVKEAGIKKSVDESVGKMMENPELKKLPPQAKKQMQEQARPIMEQMYREAAQVNSSNLTPEEKQRKLEELQKKAQEQLSKMQLSQQPKDREDSAKKSVEESLGKMMDSAEMKKLPPEAKKAVQEQARPILEEMYRQAAEVNSSNLKPEEKQHKLEELQKNAQEKMSKIQIPQPPTRIQP